MPSGGNGLSPISGQGPKGVPMGANSVLSRIARQGEQVTTLSRYDGIGIGYIVAGEVYVRTGSLYAIPASEDVLGLKGIFRDGGDFYMKVALGQAKVTDDLRSQAADELSWLRFWAD